MHNQYKSQSLYEDIIKAISSRGIATEDISIKEISAMDEFHVRGSFFIKKLKYEYLIIILVVFVFLLRTFMPLIPE